MENEGKYIYCIIPTQNDRVFGAIGIGGRGDEVMTIGYQDLAMVVSNHPMKIKVQRDNLLAHEMVIETVLKEFNSVLPVRFGTIASNADEIRSLLDRRYREFKSLLRDMDHLIELGVRGVWSDMNTIYREIENTEAEIRQEKARIVHDGGVNNDENRERVGKMVKLALQDKKQREAEIIVDALRRSAYEYKVHPTTGDEAFLNAVFLVDRGREKEFDNLMDDLSEQYQNRVNFVYAGPLPVFNFANITIYPEEWER